MEHHKKREKEEVMGYYGVANRLHKGSFHALFKLNVGYRTSLHLDIVLSRVAIELSESTYRTMLGVEASYRSSVSDIPLGRGLYLLAPAWRNWASLPIVAR